MIPTTSAAVAVGRSAATADSVASVVVGIAVNAENRMEPVLTHTLVFHALDDPEDTLGPKDKTLSRNSGKGLCVRVYSYNLVRAYRTLYYTTHTPSSLTLDLYASTYTLDYYIPYSYYRTNTQASSLGHIHARTHNYLPSCRGL